MSQTRAQLVKGLSNTSGSDDTLTIDSTGRIGLDDTPTAQFTGHSLFQVGAQASLGANKTLSTTGQTYLTHNLYFDTSGNYQVFNTSNANEGVIVQLIDGSVRFRTSAATTGTPSVGERVRIDTNGLKFNGDTAAANALDDYEEGTFTGSFNNSDNDATVSHGNQTGYYVKVGSLVHFSLYFDDIDISATGSNTNARIYGLPFASLSANQHYSVVNIIHNTILTSTAGAYVNTNTTHMIPTNVGTTTTSTFSTGTNFRLMIGGTYRAA